MQDSGGPERDKQRDWWARPVGGFAGLVQFVRGIPDRMRRPESLLMLMALLASVGAHMPPYVGLGALADYFEHEEKSKPKLPPSEVSFEIEAPSEPRLEPPKEPEPEPERALPKSKPEKKRPEGKRAEAEPPPVVEVPKPEDPKTSQLELPKPPPPPPVEERKQSITQKSQDPNVEPPPDAKYLAEESQRVEEETVAEIRDETKNDPNPQAAAPEAPGPEESGDSLADERGREHGADTPEQVAQEARAAQPPPTPKAVPQQKPAQPKVVQQKETPQMPTVIHDPMGSFVLAPAAPARRSQQGRDGRAGAQSPSQPNLRVSWNAFEQTFGREQLAQDRLPKEAKRRGAGREKRWSEFRAAIENYIEGGKPGNTTALNAAADPFAAYLAAFHRNLHMEFAHEFISSLPVGGALGDPTLVTKVEIVVNADGTLDRVGVVRSSGNLMYDFGAFNAVQRGAPYPRLPIRCAHPTAALTCAGRCTATRASAAPGTQSP